MDSQATNAHGANCKTNIPDTVVVAFQGNCKDGFIDGPAEVLYRSNDNPTAKMIGLFKSGIPTGVTYYLIEQSTNKGGRPVHLLMIPGVPQLSVKDQAYFDASAFEASSSRINWDSDQWGWRSGDSATARIAWQSDSILTKVYSLSDALGWQSIDPQLLRAYLERNQSLQHLLPPPSPSTTLIIRAAPGEFVARTANHCTIIVPGLLSQFRQAANKIKFESDELLHYSAMTWMGDCAGGNIIKGSGGISGGGWAISSGTLASPQGDVSDIDEGAKGRPPLSENEISELHAAYDKIVADNTLAEMEKRRAAEDAEHEQQLEQINSEVRSQAFHALMTGVLDATAAGVQTYADLKSQSTASNAVPGPAPPGSTISHGCSEQISSRAPTNCNDSTRLTAATGLPRPPVNPPQHTANPPYRPNANSCVELKDSHIFNNCNQMIWVTFCVYQPKQTQNFIDNSDAFKCPNGGLDNIAAGTSEGNVLHGTIKYFACSGDYTGSMWTAFYPGNGVYTVDEKGKLIGGATNGADPNSGDFVGLCGGVGSHGLGGYDAGSNLYPPQ